MKKICFLFLLLTSGLRLPTSVFGADLTFGTPPQVGDSETIIRQRLAVSLWNLEHASGGVASSVSISNWPGTQAVSIATLPLPTGASTEATLALIKAKTDNLDVLLSTRTKPADTQPVSAASLPLPSGASTEATLALIKAKTDNLDVLLSTRTKPADTQPVSAASLPLPSGASTEATLALIKAKTDNLDVALSTRTKPADTQPVSHPTLTKGTQGVNGISTQDLKDAGRTFVTFNADAVAGVTSNTILTFSKNVGNTVTATQTSYTITSGKTFRVQHITIALRSAAAAIAFAKIYLRSNSGGATVATSNIIWSTEINTNSATSGTGAWAVVDFPDGFEIAGDGTKSIGLSHLDQATTNLVSATLVGYEY